MIYLACKIGLKRYFDGMNNGWLDRLKSVIKKALAEGESMRSISEEAGLNPNYVGQLMNGSQPTVEKFLALCDALNVDPVEILTGVKQQNPAIGRALRVFASWSDDQQKRFLDWIEAAPTPPKEQKGEEIPPPPDDQSEQ